MITSISTHWKYMCNRKVAELQSTSNICTTRLNFLSRKAFRDEFSHRQMIFKYIQQWHYGRSQQIYPAIFMLCNVKCLHFIIHVLGSYIWPKLIKELGYSCQSQAIASKMATITTGHLLIGDEAWNHPLMFFRWNGMSKVIQCIYCSSILLLSHQ